MGPAPRAGTIQEAIMPLSRLFSFCRDNCGFLSLGVTIVGIMLYTNGFFGSWTASSHGACNIKGNVSASGELIYHVPGGGFYDRTLVSGTKGERWFCSETEARAAGWRRSKR
jgi:hypothetical protein